jgi:hypothetical protein
MCLVDPLLGKYREITKYTTPQPDTPHINTLCVDFDFHENITQKITCPAYSSEIAGRTEGVACMRYLKSSPVLHDFLILFEAKMLRRTENPPVSR